MEKKRISFRKYWNAISSDLLKILHSPLDTSTHRYKWEELYSFVHRLCNLTVHDYPENLAKHLEITKTFQGRVGQPHSVYLMLQNFLSNYLQDLYEKNFKSEFLFDSPVTPITPSEDFTNERESSDIFLKNLLSNKTAYNLLRVYNEEWEKFCFSGQIISSLFHYLDENYLKNPSNLCPRYEQPSHLFPTSRQNDNFISSDQEEHEEHEGETEEKELKDVGSKRSKEKKNFDGDNFLTLILPVNELLKYCWKKKIFKNLEKKLKMNIESIMNKLRVDLDEQILIQNSKRNKEDDLHEIYSHLQKYFHTSSTSTTTTSSNDHLLSWESHKTLFSKFVSHVYTLDPNLFEIEFILPLFLDTSTTYFKKLIQYSSDDNNNNGLLFTRFLLIHKLEKSLFRNLKNIPNRVKTNLFEERYNNHFCHNILTTSEMNNFLNQLISHFFPELYDNRSRRRRKVPSKINFSNSLWKNTISKVEMGRSKVSEILKENIVKKSKCIFQNELKVSLSSPSSVLSEFRRNDEKHIRYIRKLMDLYSYFSRILRSQFFSSPSCDNNNNNSNDERIFIDEILDDVFWSLFFFDFEEEHLKTGIINNMYYFNAQRLAKLVHLELKKNKNNQETREEFDRFCVVFVPFFNFLKFRRFKNRRRISSEKGVGGGGSRDVYLSFHTSYLSQRLVTRTFGSSKNHNNNNDDNDDEKKVLRILKIYGSFKMIHLMDRMFKDIETSRSLTLKYRGNKKNRRFNFYVLTKGSWKGMKNYSFEEEEYQKFYDHVFSTTKMISSVFSIQQEFKKYYLEDVYREGGRRIHWLPHQSFGTVKTNLPYTNNRYYLLVLNTFHYLVLSQFEKNLTVSGRQIWNETKIPLRILKDTLKRLLDLKILTVVVSNDDIVDTEYRINLNFSNPKKKVYVHYFQIFSSSKKDNNTNNNNSLKSILKFRDMKLQAMISRIMKSKKCVEKNLLMKLVRQQCQVIGLFKPSRLMVKKNISRLIELGIMDVRFLNPRNSKDDSNIVVVHGDEFRDSIFYVYVP